MNCEAAVRYLLSLGRELAAPTQAAAAKFDLENSTTLATHLGRPDRAYPLIHIAGTNGKGSTAAFTESILRRAGFRTGLYTSPHLERLQERIRVNGEEISEAEFAEAFTRLVELIEKLLARGRLRAHPTFFECLTALAFDHFARQRVEFAVIEVGLGGRLDSTNIVTPVVSIITRLDFDHENFLGHSLPEIAREKAGILKPGVPVVLAAQRPEARAVVVERARELGCELLEPSRLFQLFPESSSDGRERARISQTGSAASLELAPALFGRFQMENALNSVGAVRLLQAKGYRISDRDLEEGIASTSWPGRLEKLQSGPDLYLDGAHNPSAARELAGFVAQNFAGRKLWLVFGALRDKAVDEVAGVLFPLAAQVLFTQARTSRAVSPAQLVEIAAHHAGSFRVIPSADQALELALSEAAPTGVVLVTGSLYLVGELRRYWKSRSPVPAA